ncbi:MAG TPA: Spy/CpxP family protein refolding chaperone [Pyrinomonadaceae bacterium]
MMITKRFIAPTLLIFTVLLAAASVGAQVRPGASRPLDQSRVEAAEAGDPQIGQRRFPRGPNRPLPDPQANRQPGANQVKKQRLRQMVMQRLALTPDQRVRMQEIRRSHEDETISTGRRLRQARAALDRAIMSESYNEDAVRRATEELAAAQADKIRLESRIRSQVRGVLTSEQVLEFNRLQREMRREMQQQKRGMQQDRTGPAEPLVPTSRPPLDNDDRDLLSLLTFEN